MQRSDQLKVCNNLNVPVNDFKAAFCDRCMQPECTRSLYGKSKFDQRVISWEDRLFKDVPRLDESDPRYKEISAKNFKMVSQATGWGDPDRPVSVQVPERLDTPITNVVDNAPTSVSVDPTPTSVGAKVPNRPVRIPTNTTVPKEGIMLPGAPVKQAGPVADKWDVPPSETVVKKGATVRLGGGKPPEEKP